VSYTAFMEAGRLPPLEPDPVIEAYKRDVDRTLLRERLKRTPTERVEDLAALVRFADELAVVGHRAAGPMSRSATSGDGAAEPSSARIAPMLPAEIRDEASVLFHDTRVEDVDPETHAAFVIQRVLDRGTMRSVRALVHFYGTDRIRRFFVEGGFERVSSRTAPLWAAFLQLDPDACIPKSSARRSSPSWKA
jgi:hypothetical protein